MEDELFDTLYRVVQHEATLRPRRKRVRFSDAVILLVAFWAVLHDRPVRWACAVRNWHGVLPWEALPSPATMSRRLRTLSVQLLLEQVFYVTVYRRADFARRAAGAEVVGCLPPWTGGSLGSTRRGRSRRSP